MGQGEPQLSLPHSVAVLSRNVSFIAPAADHRRFLAGLSNADPKLPPIKVLLGWRGAVDE